MIANHLSCAILSLLLVPRIAISTVTHINLTTTAAENEVSVLQCWQLNAPFITSTQKGTAGAMVAQLGNLANASYSIIPAGSNGGNHVAPVVQYVAFLSDAAKITFPNSSQEARISSGENGLFFAADTAKVSKLGHGTLFTKATILLQVPTADGIVPPHEVLYSGACEHQRHLW